LPNVSLFEERVLYLRLGSILRNRLVPCDGFSEAKKTIRAKNRLLNHLDEQTLRLEFQARVI
jgi:hypothetical protein